MITEEERQKLRKKRSRARKRKKVAKRILAVLVTIILVLAAFVAAVKITNPDFEFSSLFPQGKIKEVVALIDKTTTKKASSDGSAEDESEKTAVVKKEYYDYVEFSDFEFDTALQGNQLGNLLNKSQGAVTYSSSYIYYSIPGKGIYRFEPNEEKNSKVKTGDFNFKYLNVLGDYLYAIDTDSAELKKMPVSGGDSVTVADNISFAYLYNDKIYFISTDNSAGYINTSDFSKTVLYTADADKTLSFAGISLSRIFLAQYDSVGNYFEYITVSLSDSSDCKYFREDTQSDDITDLYFECGFMYYYEKQADGSYSLCRQKFGSENVVTLIENATVCDCPVVYNNRLYYSELDGSSFKARELNMNSMSKKTMVKVSDSDGSGTLAVGYGYQYVFLIGTKSDGGDNVCKASCIYTSSSGDNTLTFSDGKLQYQ